MSAPLPPSPPLYALVDTVVVPQAPVVFPSLLYDHTTQAQSSPQPLFQDNTLVPQRQFDYKTESRGRAVAILTLSAAAAYSKDIATYLGRDPIMGTVRLHLEKPTVVKSIGVSITGRCKPKDRTGADNLFDEDTTFLDISHTVWAAQDPKDRRGILGPPGAHGVNRSASSHSLGHGGHYHGSGNGHGSTTGAGRLSLTDGKLQGDCHWTFSIDLPSAVVAPSSSGAAAYATLPRLREGYYASAVYSIAVRIQREWNAPDYKIKASAAYIPVTWPPQLPIPPSLPALGSPNEKAPSISSLLRDKWYPMPTVRIMGTLRGTQSVEVGCTLFLAKPLNYTRGALIPLCMRLASHSSQALDLLSTPRAISVRLRRRGALSSMSGSHQKISSKRVPILGGDDAAPLEVGAAIWTSSKSEKGEYGEYVRYIAGELEVERGLKASSMKIEYTVVLYPFAAPEMQFAGGMGRDTILREQLVDIDETIC